MNRHRWRQTRRMNRTKGSSDMDRRSFLKWIGAASAAAAAYEIDYEKLLWTPGQKSYHFIHTPAPTIATDAEIDVVLASHGIRVPRYHMTIVGKGTFLYDTDWRLLNGSDLIKRGVVAEADIAQLQAAMIQDVKAKNRSTGFIGEFAQLPDWFPGATTRASSPVHLYDLPLNPVQLCDPPSKKVLT